MINTKQDLLDYIAKEFNIPDVTTDAHFYKDLGLDDLDMVELIIMLEDEFVIEIPDDIVSNWTIPQQIIDWLATKNIILA